MWDKKKLKTLSKQRLDQRTLAGPKVQQAALLYARLEGLTHDRSMQPKEAKSQLDKLLDSMQPNDWLGLDGLKETVGEPAIRGLMSYSMRRAYEAVNNQADAVGKMRDWPVKKRQTQAKMKERDR